MTNRAARASGSEVISVLEDAVNGMPVMRSPAAGLDMAAAGRGAQSFSSDELLPDRVIRLRLLAGSALGVAFLILALRAQPGGGSPFAAPSGLVGWTAMLCGIAGIWLVPGLWLSAVMMRTGPDLVAWLATRIGTTLVWYAMVGPIIHDSAQQARVTTGGIFGATTAATGAVCLGVALGLLRRPADHRLRMVLAAVVGGISAQISVWLSMRVWTYDMNYQHIRRLDWLIVLGCALLTTIGMHSRPELPSVRAARQMHKIFLVLAVIAISAVALLSLGARWSPEQRTPSAFSVEQVPAREGADVALAVTAIGPEGSRLIQRAFFTASDDTGRPVGVRTRLVVGDRTADRPTLLVVLDARSRPVLCGRTARGSQQGRPVKLTVRDEASGVLVQALIPAGWCAG
jgi:hypothetical protein